MIWRSPAVCIDWNGLLTLVGAGCRISCPVRAASVISTMAVVIASNFRSKTNRCTPMTATELYFHAVPALKAVTDNSLGPQGSMSADDPTHPAMHGFLTAIRRRLHLIKTACCINIPPALRSPDLDISLADDLVSLTDMCEGVAMILSECRDPSDDPAPSDEIDSLGADDSADGDG